MMNKLKRSSLRFLADEEGPTTVEYAVMLMLIIMAAIGTLQLVGGALNDSFGDSSQQIKAAMDARNI